MDDPEDKVPAGGAGAGQRRLQCIFHHSGRGAAARRSVTRFLKSL